MQPARADILNRRVDLLGEERDLVDRLGLKLQVDPFGRKQRPVLFHQARFRLGQDAAQIGAVERLQFDPDRQPALQLGQQVGGLRQMEGARGDKEDVVGLDGAMLGGDRGAFDERQQIALHAFAANIGPGEATATLGTPADLVDLVEKDDAVLLG